MGTFAYNYPLLNPPARGSLRQPISVFFLFCRNPQVSKREAYRQPFNLPGVNIHQEIIHYPSIVLMENSAWNPCSTISKYTT